MFSHLYASLTANKRAPTAHTHWSKQAAVRKERKLIVYMVAVSWCMHVHKPNSVKMKFDPTLTHLFHISVI